MKVMDLEPGMRVEMPGMDKYALFIAQTTHPLHPHLRLVIWTFPYGHPLNIKISHDALSPLQDVGDVVPDSRRDRRGFLQQAFEGGLV